MATTTTLLVLMSLLTSNSTHQRNDNYNAQFFCIETHEQKGQIAQCNDHICRMHSINCLSRPHQDRRSKTKFNNNKVNFETCKRPMNASSIFQPKKGRR